MTEPIVILGSGLAGYTAAREFRRLDKTAPLLLLSRDHAGFYSKPMLSNALASKKTAATLVMKSAERMADELGATVRPNTAVDGFDPAQRTLRLAGGETLAYRALVLALGADPVRLAFDGDAADAVLSVNDLDDYARFAEQLDGVSRVAILGAGLIGCEFANDLLHRGIVPTAIDPEPHPIARLLPPAAGDTLRERLEAAGAQFRLGRSAKRIDRAGTGLALTLDDGSVVEADLVLSAIGLKPRVAMAQAAGLQVRRGVVVDRWLDTSAPGVHAIGDCAEVEGHSLPFVLPLMAQGRALAATLAGQRTAVAYPAMPVTVKTPACPTVVCPPPAGAAGGWRTQPIDGGCEAEFLRDDGTLLGFALVGAPAVAKKAAFAARVPALIG